MNEDNIFDTQALEEAERISLAFQRDNRRYSSFIDLEKEAAE